MKIALLLGLGGLAGCDLSKQVTARTVAVSTVLTTPAITLSGDALATSGLGFDAGGFNFDGSFPFDAGALLGDAGITVPPQTLVYVFFGQRAGDSLDVAPTGAPGATVTLSELDGGSWALTDQGNGNYALSPDAGFPYHANATYDFTMALSGSTYVAEVSHVPAPERVPRFHDAPGYLLLTAGEDLVLTRVEPAPGYELPLGFLNVFPVSAQGLGEPTWTNIPRTPLEFLKLAFAPNDWKKLLITIPGSAFPDPDRNYVIVLQSAKLGGPKSDNLFAGSAILAGTADVGVVKTRR